MSFPRTPSCFCGGASWKHFSTLWGLSIAPMEKDIIEHHLFTLNLWVIFVIFSVWTRAKWSQRFCVNCSIFYLEIAYIVVTLFMKWWCYTWSNPEQDHYWLCLYGRLYLSFQHFPWVQRTHTHTSSCAQKVIFIGEGRRTAATMRRMLVGTWSHSVCDRAHIWWLLDWSHSR